MKLIKINTDHYIIVDDSEIKKGDWVVGGTRTVVQCMYPENVHHRDVKKITHSTQPLYKNDFWAIQELKLSEVKELIGEVDVEKKAEEWFLINQYNQQDMIHSHRTPEYITTKNLWVTGYNQALEDNKDKKYTEEDLRKAFFNGGNMKEIEEFNSFIQSLQPKTEWEVEYDENGKLRLKPWKSTN